MKKKEIMLVTILLLQIVVFIPSIFADNNWVIDGDKVYIDDEYVYLSAEPHTINESNWVVFELESKVYSGDIDVIWGFNITLTQPKYPQWWNGTAWVPINKNFTIINHQYKGCNKWYLLEEISIVQDVLYKARMWLNIEFNTSGKYWWALKPSGETLQEAIANGHLYYLDPWWNSSWNRNNRITIDSGFIDTTLSNFPMMVPLDDTYGNYSSNRDSIRFVGEDNTTVFDHEIESLNESGITWCWVKVSTVYANQDTVFYVYYDNPYADNIEDANGVWSSNYAVVQHLQEGGSDTRVDSTSNENNMTRYGDTTNTTGKIGLCNIFDGTNDNLSSPHDSSQSLDQWTIACWVEPDKVTSTQSMIRKGDQAVDHKNYQVFISSTGQRLNGMYEECDGTDSNQRYTGAIVTDVWYYVVYTYDGTPTQFSAIYLNTDRPASGTETTTPCTSQTSRLTIGETSAGGWVDFDGKIDEIQISNTARNWSWINASYHNQNQTTNFMTFDVVEIYQAITLTDEQPSNGSVDVSLTPSLNVTVNRSLGGDMDIFWYSNSSGSWLLFDTNLTVDNGTYRQINSNFSIYNRTYYWRVCANNDTYWLNETYHFTTEDITIDPPWNGSFEYNITTENLTINWTSGNNSDSDLLVSRNDTYATSPDQAGNWIRQNSTYSNWTDVVNTTYYFTIWSWNDTANKYSSEKLDMAWGTLFIYVMDENSPWVPVTNYTLFITNQAGTETYYATNQNNPVTLTYNDIPYGNNTIFQISQSDYKQRTWYIDLDPSGYYNFTFYLPRQEAEEGDEYVLRAYTDSKSVLTHGVNIVINLSFEIESIISVEIYNDSLYDTYGGWIYVPADLYTTNTSNATIYNSENDDNTSMARISYYYRDYSGTVAPAVYYIRVVESYETDLGVYDKAVENAKVNFQRYINTTDSFESISILLTDANGYVNLYLIPGVLYKVVITRTGFNTKSSDYTPAPANEFGQTTEKVFRISRTTADIGDYETDTVFANIEWTFSPLGVQHYSNFTIWFNITSSDCKLQWYRMSVWFYNRTLATWVLLDSQNESTACGGSLNYSIPNITGKYAIECFYKKTNFTEYEIFQQGSLVMFFSELRAGLEEFPDYAWYIILIVIMIVVMGFFYWFFGTGIATGYIGLIVFAIGLLFKPVEVPLGIGDPISGWVIFAITFLMYTAGVYLWSKI